MNDLPLGAVIAFDFETWNVADEIALLKSAGVTRVQIYRNYVQGIAAEKVRATLTDAGLAIDSLHGYFHLKKFPGPVCDLSSADPALREASLEIMRREAAYAATLGCRDIVIHPVGDGPTAGDPYRPAALVASARDLAEIARSAGVRFLIENMPPPMFTGNAELLREVVDEVGGEFVGLAFDVGHATLAKDPIGTILAMGPRLWGVHLHDTRGTEDDHLIPGLGAVPFDDVARALAQVNFRGTFMIEVYRPTAEVRRDLTPAVLENINRLRRIASGM